jgi:hypothetical protein
MGLRPCRAFASVAIVGGCAGGNRLLIVQTEVHAGGIIASLDAQRARAP